MTAGCRFGCISCVQTLIARDRVIIFERRSKVTKRYGEGNFLAHRRCHCYTTENVMERPRQNCDAINIFSNVFFCMLACFKGSPSRNYVNSLLLVANSTREKLGNERSNIFMATGVFKLQLLRIYASDLDAAQDKLSSGII